MNLHRDFVLRLLFIGSLLSAGCDSIFLNEQSLDRTQWIKHAAGMEQCVPYEFASIEEAINELHKANIDVLSSKKVEFPVCRACFCPVGLEFYALINQKQLPLAINIGWTEVNDSTESHSMTP